MTSARLIPPLVLLAACAEAMPTLAHGCDDAGDPLLVAERADAVLLVRAAPLTAPGVVRTESDLRAATRPAREDRIGPAPRPLRTDGRTFRIMAVIAGDETASDLIRLDAAPTGCPAEVGRTYVLTLGPDGATVTPASGEDDPLVRQLRALRR